jgi:phospholipid-binding lipoprotein MlaA
MRSNTMHNVVRAGLLALTLLTGACATTPPPGSDVDAYAPNDPIEPVNRAIFSFNVFADDYVIRPVAQAYRDYLPDGVRNSIHNFLANLRAPIIFANDALQGQGKLAGDTFGRFWVNTFLGLGGFIDVGTKIGIPYHNADFGQTLGTWGIGSGPYIVLPILGPSNPRDTVGLVADTLGDPFRAVMSEQGDAGDYVNYSRAVISGIDLRSRNIDLLDRLRSTSLDYYATIRSIYDQRRAAEIRHETPPNAPPGLTP